MKTYKVIVSFGNGLPKETTISAKSGALAQEKALREFPGARLVHVVSAISEELPRRPKKRKTHPLFYP